MSWQTEDNPSTSTRAIAKEINRPHSVRTVEFEEAVSLRTEDNPCTRAVAKEINRSSSVLTVQFDKGVLLRTEDNTSTRFIAK